MLRICFTGLLALAAGVSQARPPVTAGGPVVAPAYGGARWVGGPYRPWIGGGVGWRAPGYRWGPGWGYPGWGYAGWGYGGWGYRAAWGYGPGWGWGWGWPAASVAVVPSIYPYGAALPAEPWPADDVAYVQQAPQAADPAPQAAPAQPAGKWYYCTEPAGYHPYVSQCRRPWIAVEPRP